MKFPRPANISGRYQLFITRARFQKVENTPFGTIKNVKNKCRILNGEWLSRLLAQKGKHNKTNNNNNNHNSFGDRVFLASLALPVRSDWQNE